jgi:hypothetical protein
MWCCLSIQPQAHCQSFHVLGFCAAARMLRFRISALDLHLAVAPIEAAFITLAMRASPNYPVAFLVTGAVVYGFIETGKGKFAHVVLRVKIIKMRLGAKVAGDKVVEQKWSHYLAFCKITRLLFQNKKIK